MFQPSSGITTVLEFIYYCYVPIIYIYTPAPLDSVYPSLPFQPPFPRGPPSTWTSPITLALPPFWLISVHSGPVSPSPTCLDQGLHYGCPQNLLYSPLSPPGSPTMPLSIKILIKCTDFETQAYIRPMRHLPLPAAELCIFCLYPRHPQHLSVCCCFPRPICGFLHPLTRDLPDRS